MVPDMQTPLNWHLKFWRIDHLNDVEFLHASQVTHKYPLHMHENFSISVQLAGTEELVCNGSSHKARRGDLILINAEQVHSNKSIRSEYRLFKLWPEAFRRMTGNPNIPHFPKVVVNDPFLFRALLELHIKLEEPGSALEQESQFISTMALLLERQTEKQVNSDTKPTAKKEDVKVRLVREYLRDHYAENVSLSQLTSLTNLSPFYLLRVFRNRAGFPPHEYQTQVRIAHARRLIRSGTPVSQAAIETGFFDQSHLTRNFKRIVGVTPRQYFRG
jgi:AraC-like DNA-binding protein